MAFTPRLINGGILTYSAAKRYDSNVLHDLSYYSQKVEFNRRLLANRELLQAAAAHHLGVSRASCIVSGQNEWLEGTYNLCIPITILARRSFAHKRVIIRFPLPYRVGEAFHAGNMDEKLRSEAATYAWLQEHCPAIPIPRLHGFALSTGQSFTALDILRGPWRWFHSLCRSMKTWLGYRGLSQYIPDWTPCGSIAALGSGYLLIDFIESSQGRMLSETWSERHGDNVSRQKLFSSLSKIQLNLTQIPLPVIGSFTINDSGAIGLTNRPLLQTVTQLENQHIPVDIDRSFTYHTGTDFIADVLEYHASRVRYQPNAVPDLKNGLFQLSAQTLMRTTSRNFIRRDLDRGPFVLTFTDLHQSNIFVDEDWQVTCIIDVEYACALPLSMQHPPYWLSDDALDKINEVEYDELRKEYMLELKTEEQSCLRKDGMLLSSIMEEGWESGAFWYNLALQSFDGLYHICFEYISKEFVVGKDRGSLLSNLSLIWDRNVTDFLDQKVKDHQQYDQALKQKFQV